MGDDDEWELPVPREDPEIYKAGAARDGDGPAAKDDFTEDEGGKGPSGCPFSS